MDGRQGASWYFRPHAGLKALFKGKVYCMVMGFVRWGGHSARFGNKKK